MQRVLITRASYGDCRKVVEAALSAFPVPVRGRKVLVKVNGMAGTEPEEGIITHPDILRALVRLLEEMGAGQIQVGDNPGIAYYGRNEAAFAESGLLEAAGGHYCNLGKEARAVPFDPSFIKQVFPSSAVLDADVVISVPKFKTHARVGVSVGLKNSFGTLPGAQKANMHHLAGSPVNFSRALVEVFRLRPPDLFIVDAVLGGQGMGPHSPDLRYLGLLMASDNAVALDSTVARMVGYEPDQVPLLRFAQEVGLGSCREEDIEVIGTLERLRGFAIPPLADIISTDNIHYGGGMAETPHFRPIVDNTRCDGCRVCADGCPAGALTMSKGLPLLNAAACVPCYCCKEACPQQAIAMGKLQQSTRALGTKM